MKINWKLRLKNKATLTAIISALIVFTGSVANALGFDITGVLSNVEGTITSLLMLLVALGVITDPTSKGVSDSEIAQTYDKPRNSQNPEEYVDWESNQYTPEQWHDDNKVIDVDEVEGLRDVEDERFETIRRNFDSDINNSGVMLDTSQQVEGGAKPDENSRANQ